MQPLVKYCGMTRLEDVRAADRLGVDFIGLIFVRSSPRRVTLEQAKSLKSAIIRAKVVGVFDDSEPDAPNRVAAELGLDFVQLHGSPNPELAGRVELPVIQAFRGVPAPDELRRFLAVRTVSYVLLDKRKDEEAIDLDAAAMIPVEIRNRMFLAGGLTPENVRHAINSVRPFAVDCARGIESGDGVKDYNKMQHFFQKLQP